MPLVDYSSSEGEEEEEEENDNQPPPTKRPRMSSTRAPKNNGTQLASNLELPASFHTLYATNVRTSTTDDPNLHGGRKRQTPHVEGNWPTHAYLEWHPTTHQISILERLISQYTSQPDSNKSKDREARSTKSSSAKVCSLLESELGAPQALHISLSRTLQLRTDDRDAFLSSITSSIRSAGIRPFDVSFNDVGWFANYERNRWFLSLEVEKSPRNELNRLLFACNRACLGTGLPILYYGPDQDGMARGSSAMDDEERLAWEEKAKELDMRDCSGAFHVSIAYTLEHPAAEESEGGVSSKGMRDELEKLTVKLNAVKVKIGNKIHSIEFGRRSSLKNNRKHGIFG
jgi:U6 snRNA phosphodiesterase